MNNVDQAERCQCEQIHCGHHLIPCDNPATQPVKTPLGTLNMCAGCAGNMSSYLKAFGEV